MSVAGSEEPGSLREGGLSERGLSVGGLSEGGSKEAYGKEELELDSYSSQKEPCIKSIFWDIPL